MSKTSNSSGGKGKGKVAPKYSPPEKISRYARVTRLATDQSVDKEIIKDKLEKVDSNLLNRIQKMLKLAQHPNTSEAEAKQALRASARMLSAANLTESEIMSKESEEEQNQRAGHSIVTIRNKVENKSVFIEQWSTNLASAIECAFNVKYFFTTWRSHDRIEFTFYGLRDNTVAAVISFEAVFNLSLTWAATRKDLKGRTERNCYLLGLSFSLYRMAKKEKEEEEKQAIENEKIGLLKDEEIKVKEEQKRQEMLQDPTFVKKEFTKSVTIADEEEDDDIIFVSIKPGPKRTKEEPRVKDEVVSSDDDKEGFDTLEAEGGESDDDDDEFFDAGGEEEQEEEEIGDLKSEQRRFDEAFERRPDTSSIPALRKREREDPLSNIDLNFVKKEDDDDVKPTIKSDPSIKEEEAEAEMAAWQSHAQLVRFKETATRVAEDYLKEINAKIKHSKAKQRQSKHDASAYKKGQEDARKVDLKRRRLEAD